MAITATHRIPLRDPGRRRGSYGADTSELPGCDWERHSQGPLDA